MTTRKALRRIPAKDVPIVSTLAEQLTRWVEGQNVHAKVAASWECCPDFSCCYPDCAVAPAVRRKFAAADADERLKFYGEFLSAFVRKVSKRPLPVHIAGSVSLKGGRRVS